MTKHLLPADVPAFSPLSSSPPADCLNKSVILAHFVSQHYRVPPPPWVSHAHNLWTKRHSPSIHVHPSPPSSVFCQFSLTLSSSLHLPRELLILSNADGKMGPYGFYFRAVSVEVFSSEKIITLQTKTTNTSQIRLESIPSGIWSRNRND